MKYTAPPQLVGIVGGSSAGKTWLAEQLQKLLGEKVARLSLDDFYLDRSYLPPSQREKLNFDHPKAIEWPLVEQVLKDVIAWRVTRLPRYDFASHTRLAGPQVWQPKPLILMEGLWLFYRAPVRRMFDLRIFIDCPERVRLRRRLTRDSRERGRTPESIRQQLKETVMPMHDKYVAPQSRWADVVMKFPFEDEESRQLADRLWELLKAGSLLPAWMRETFRAELQALLQITP